MFTGILQTFFISMLPLVELRLGIPVGYAQFDVPIMTAVVVAILGNIISVGLVLRALPWIVKLSLRVSIFKLVLDKIFEKTRSKHSKKIEHLGEIALVLFVAVPIPGSGGWTGALIAFLFGLSYWKSMKFISIGLILAGILVGMLTVGVDKLVNIFV